MSILKVSTIQEGLLPLLARVLIALIFIQGALGKIGGWEGQASYMSRHGLRFIPPLLGAALAIEALGVLCLLLGAGARAAAAIMFAYLMVVSVLLHDFWGVTDPMAAGMRQTEFLKNMGIGGGLLLIAAFGPGRWALRPTGGPRFR